MFCNPQIRAYPNHFFHAPRPKNQQNLKPKQKSQSKAHPTATPIQKNILLTYQKDSKPREITSINANSEKTITICLRTIVPILRNRR